MSIHVDRLRELKVDADVTPKELLNWATTDSDEFIVEQIIEHHGSGKTGDPLQFKIRWEGYGPDEDTWLNYKDVKDLEALNNEQFTVCLKRMLAPADEKATDRFKLVVMKADDLLLTIVLNYHVDWEWNLSIMGDISVSTLQSEPKIRNEIFVNIKGNYKNILA